jgi:hypothetical protein
MNEVRNKNYEVYVAFGHGAKYVRDMETKERIGCYPLAGDDSKFEWLKLAIAADGGSLWNKDKEMWIIEPKKVSNSA